MLNFCQGRFRDALPHLCFAEISHQSKLNKRNYQFGEIMTKDKIEFWEKCRKLFSELTDTHSEIDLKGKTSPYTSINGHMFSILDKDGNLGLRLPKEERLLFLEEHQTKLHEAYGTVMREYVRVPHNLLVNTHSLSPYLIISFDYVKSLKPKPTKKK